MTHSLTKYQQGITVKVTRISIQKATASSLQRTSDQRTPPKTAAAQPLPTTQGRAGQAPQAAEQVCRNGPTIAGPRKNTIVGSPMPSPRNAAEKIHCPPSDKSHFASRTARQRASPGGRGEPED